MKAKSGSCSDQEWRRDRWLVLGRFGSGALLAGLVLVLGGTMRSPAGVASAAVIAGMLGAATWLRPGSRTGSVLALVGDLGWVTLAAVASGRPEMGITLFYPMVAFAAGISLGGLAALGISLAAGAALIGVSWATGGFGTGPTSVVVQGMLVMVLGLVSSRMRSVIRVRERALVSASKALERIRLDTDTIVQNLASGLISVDAGGRIVHLNRVAEETLELEADRVRGRAMREALVPGCRALVETLETGLAEGTSVQRMELDIVRSDRSVPLGLGTTILHGRDNEVTGVAALFQDLTEIRRADELRKRKERMAAVGELAAGIAHEIRNSILPVSGSVQLLTQELKPNGEQAKLFEVIERETDNIERFVSALLSYTRERRVHAGKIDLAALARDMVRDLELSRPGAATVTVEGDRAPAWADPDQLRQLVRNLVANAADATGSDGTIRLRTGLTDGRAWIEVEDDGPGIPDELRGSVFQPFFTTKAGGTGLGLSIVARIVEDHGGELEVGESESGGARFRVVLAGTDEVSGVTEAAA